MSNTATFVEALIARLVDRNRSLLQLCKSNNNYKCQEKNAAAKWCITRNVCRLGSQKVIEAKALHPFDICLI